MKIAALNKDHVFSTAKKVFLTNEEGTMDMYFMEKILKVFSNIEGRSTFESNDKVRWTITAFEIDVEKELITIFGGTCGCEKDNPHHWDEATNSFKPGYDGEKTESADVDTLLSSTDFGCRKKDVEKVVKFLLGKIEDLGIKQIGG
jgi:hypothetical protein